MVVVYQLLAPKVESVWLYVVALTIFKNVSTHLSDLKMLARIDQILKC
jgi:hypothetical protein